MKNIDQYLEKLYLENEYIIKNPSLHEEDTPWKLTKIVPLVDEYIGCINKKKVTLLDVGGGAGLILSAISDYISDTFNIQIDKMSLDLSPGILDIQKIRNPDLKKCLNEDICKTSLADKEIDLTLMIDVLEHVPNLSMALEEVMRVSQFVIFKVPLEDNLHSRLMNFITGGKLRKSAIESTGHVNSFNYINLIKKIEKHTGHIIDTYFTNIFYYFEQSDIYKNNMKQKEKIRNHIAGHIFKISPKLCSMLFRDHIMVLVRCY